MPGAFLVLASLVSTHSSHVGKPVSGSGRVHGRSSGFAGFWNGFIGGSVSRCGDGDLRCGSGFGAGFAGAGGAFGASPGAKNVIPMGLAFRPFTIDDVPIAMTACMEHLPPKNYSRPGINTSSEFLPRVKATFKKFSIPVSMAARFETFASSPSAKRRKHSSERSLI